MKLVPPDRKKCQTEIPNGITFMTMGGGVPGRIRCKNRPNVIVYKKKPKGSMSMCNKCLTVFVKQVGMKGCKVKGINNATRSRIKMA